MTTRFDLATRRPNTSGKDTEMFQIELRLADVRERQARLRALRDADRAAFGSARSLRSRLGELIIRLGRRVAGESLTSPVWTG